MVSGKLLCSTGSSAQCSVMTCRGGMGLGGREAQGRGDTCVHIADSHCCTQKLAQHYKAIILQLKINKLKKILSL